MLEFKRYALLKNWNSGKMYVNWSHEVVYHYYVFILLTIVYTSYNNVNISKDKSCGNVLINIVILISSNCLNEGCIKIELSFLPVEAYCSW